MSAVDAVDTAALGADAPMTRKAPAGGWSLRDLALVAIVGVLFLAAWQVVPGLIGIPPFIIPSVTDCAVEMVRLYQQENLVFHVANTVAVALGGFFIGGLFGAACGYLLGLSETVERIISPYLLALQIAPKVAFAPLFIMWFGYNAVPKLLVTVLVVFFPILVNVLQSMRTVDRDMINLARAYNFSRAGIFWRIEFPASMPPLMAGLRIGATLAIIGVTVGELVGGNTGLGFLITYGEGQADTAMVFDAIILLTVIGIVLYAATDAVEKRLLHYIPKANH